ncbi:MAG: hypothetical protein ACKV2T_19810 [Kofleriaceae bacterium]
MTLDTALTSSRLRELLTSIHPGAVSPADAEAIIELAQLVVDADGREDADEIKTFFELGKAVFTMAGMSTTPTPTFLGFDDDGERMRELAGKLVTKEGQELAFACAHLLSISDVDIAPEEDAFIAALRFTLSITTERGDEIAAQLNAAITPSSDNSADT